MPSEQRYRAVPVSMYGLDGEAVVVVPAAGRASYVLPAEDARVLLATREFLPLSEHAQRIAAGTRAEMRSISDRLARLATAGWLKPFDAFVGASDAPPRRSVEPAVSWLTVPTRDRTEDLERCVRSYAGNARAHGRAIRVFVSDDGGRASPSCLTVLQEIARSFGLEVSYATRAHRQQYARLLSVRGRIPPQVVSFALLGDGWPGESIGANRNAILLRTRGDSILSVDDDTVCRPRLAPAPSRSDLDLRGDGDVSEVWFCPDRAAAQDAGRAADVDVFGEHAALLGRSLSAAARARGADTIRMDDACDHLLASLLSHRGTVVATMNGLAGDAAVHSFESFGLHDSLETRRRFVALRESGSPWRSREVIRQAPATTVSHGGHFMSTYVGLDNRTLLPPFMPSFRSEDRVFSETLGHCGDGVFYGHLPWTLDHSPGNARVEPSKPWETTRMADLVVALMASAGAAAGPGDIGSRLSRVGSQLEDWASAAAPEFGARLGAAVQEQIFSLVGQQEAMIRSAPELGERWAADVRTRMHGALKQLRRPNSQLATELSGRVPDGATSAEVQRFVRELGRLFRWWPAIVQTADELAAAGCVLGAALA